MFIAESANMNVKGFEVQQHVPLHPLHPLSKLLTTLQRAGHVLDIDLTEAHPGKIANADGEQGHVWTRSAGCRWRLVKQHMAKH